MSLVGSHVTKSKRGWIDSLGRVKSLGGSVAQIFISSPIGKMSEKTLTELRTDGHLIREWAHANGMTLFIHSPYTLNFAKDPMKESPYWVRALITELEVADIIGAKACVLHMGKAVGQTVQMATDLMYTNVKTVLDTMRERNIKARLLLETSAGQGTEILTTIQELSAFFARFDTVHHKNLGFCIDTCHIYASGYDIDTPSSVDAFFRQWNDAIGLRHVHLVHFNNSVHPRGSRKDRHACLEHGKIPVSGLQAFGARALQHGIPIVLETPEGETEIPVALSIVL